MGEEERAAVILDVDHSVLWCISEHPGCDLGEIAVALDSSEADISRSLGRLRAMEAVAGTFIGAWQAGGPLRALHLVLTAHGRDMLAALGPPR